MKDSDGNLVKAWQERDVAIDRETYEPTTHGVPKEPNTVAKFRPKIDWEMRAKKNLKAKVEFGRKLGKLQKNITTARSQVTKECARLALIGCRDTDWNFLVLRNTVRALKGKNLL